MTTCRVINTNASDLSVRLGEYELKFEYTDFGPEYEERAKKELREEPEIADKAITALRKLVRDEPGFTILNDDDEFLRLFLRPCKYYPESAMERMRKFYKFKVKNPKYYLNLLPSLDSAAFQQSLLTVAPVRSARGERILIIEAGRKWIPKDCSLLQITRAAVITLEAAIKEPRTQVAGGQVILDMEGLSMQHIWQFTPLYAKEVATFVQECIPLRMKGIHIVYQPYVFNMLFAIFKPFLSPKLRNRIHFHGTNFKSMHEHLDRNCLPKKYDGLANYPLNEGEKLLEYCLEFEEDYAEMARSGYLGLKS